MKSENVKKKIKKRFILKWKPTFKKEYFEIKMSKKNYKKAPVA